jgi:hypothetical protein
MDVSSVGPRLCEPLPIVYGIFGGSTGFVRPTGLGLTAVERGSPDLGCVSVMLSHHTAILPQSESIINDFYHRHK